MKQHLLFQSLQIEMNDAEYGFLKLNQNLLATERRLDSLQEEILHLLAEAESKMQMCVTNIA